MRQTMSTNRLDDIPFNKVEALYCQRLCVESTNDLKGRIRLLRKYPELFNTNV